MAADTASIISTSISGLSFLGVIFLGYLNLRQKAEAALAQLQLANKVEEVRKEFSAQYVSEKFELERRQNVLERIEDIEDETKRNREKIHDIYNMSTAVQLGVSNIEVKMSTFRCNNPSNCER